MNRIRGVKPVSLFIKTDSRCFRFSDLIVTIAEWYLLSYLPIYSQIELLYGSLIIFIGRILRMKIDAYDKKILRELQKNGRLSNVELAEKVGLSESPCLRRVRALEAENLITGYHATLDHHQLGLDITAYIQVNLDQRSEANTKAFQEAVNQEPHIVECYALSGNYDYLLKVVAADLDEFAELTMQRILRFPGVDNITSGLTLKVLKKYSGYPI